MALIELFDVRPDDDEAFLADWRRERNGTLYRALRDDAAPRFVSIAAGGAYELVHEDGTADPAGGAVRIEAFDDAQLLPSWRQARDAFSRRRGYRGTRLYHSPTAMDFRFVAFAHWSSPLMVARALREPEVQAAVALVASQPALYTELVG